MQHQYALDCAWPEQSGKWLANIAQEDFVYSFAYNRPADLIGLEQIVEENSSEAVKFRTLDRNFRQ